MMRYVFVRFVSFLPALLIGIVLLFCFRLLPSESKWEEKVENIALQTGDFQQARIDEAKKRIRHQLGLHLPVFYLSFRSAATPSTIPDSFSGTEKDWIRKISLYSGEAEKTIVLAELLKAQGFRDWSSPLPEEEALSRVRQWLFEHGNKEGEILRAFGRQTPSLAAYLPALDLHGKNNQFHWWLVKLLGGDLGKSWQTNENVTVVVARATTNSLMFTMPAFFLSFVVAYWLVVVMAGLRPTLKHIADQLLYFFDLVPLFGWALLLIIVFSSGLVLSWFPSIVSLSTLSGASFWERSIWPYVLPTIALILFSVPLITRHIDNSFQKTAQSAFVLAAFSRGLSQQTIIRDYRMRYSLLPAITLVGEFFFSIVGGAIVVEVAFSIPGMGKLLTNAVIHQDYPVVTGVILVFILAQMASYLVTDFLYYAFDPRIRLSTQSRTSL